MPLPCCPGQPATHCLNGSRSPTRSCLSLPSARITGVLPPLLTTLLRPSQKSDHEVKSCQKKTWGSNYRGSQSRPVTQEEIPCRDECRVEHCVLRRMDCRTLRVGRPELTSEGASPQEPLAHCKGRCVRERNSSVFYCVQECEAQDGKGKQESELK